MRWLNGKKLSCARTDHSDDIHAQMAAIFCHPSFSVLFVPAFSGTRIALKAGLVGKLNIYALIETVNPLSQCPIGYQQCIADKLCADTGQQHLDGCAACCCFIRAQP